MNRRDWLVIYRRAPHNKGNGRYYFDMPFSDVDIKLQAKNFVFMYEDEGGYHYSNSKMIGHEAVIMKRGDQ